MAPKKPRTTIRVGQVWRDGDKRLGGTYPHRYFIAKALAGDEAPPTTNPMERILLVACDKDGTMLANAVTGITRIRADRMAKGDWIYQGQAPAHTLRLMAMGPEPAEAGAVLFQGDIEAVAQ